MDAKALPSDPWAHRAEGLRCKTCMWFVPKRPAPVPLPDGGTLQQVTIEIGRCRRHAPTMDGYPVAFVNDWCGDHKLNENAI